ncbi:MAG TPA: energy transducer TonB [Methylophilus sp.]|nr:energy transducer TonB [Methylophilus sp.]
MSIAAKQSFAHENTLLWAVIASMMLHILLAVVVPNFKFELVREKPVELSIELQKPEPPAPELQKIPEPPKQPVEELKPEPIRKLKPKPIPKPIEQPSPVVETPPPTDISDTPPPAVITAAPTAEAKPEFVAPPPPAEPPKVIEPSPAEVDDALSEYGNQLGRAIAKHKQYPRIAQMRGWQGDVILDLKIDGGGKVLSASVRESSGFEALDKQALEMARKAAPFPAPPQALRNRTFNITVPVSFKLQES